MHRESAGFVRWLVVVAVNVAIALCAVFGTDVWAAGPSVKDFQVTTWTRREGVPASTWAMAQTADGWLWLGGPDGLHRFDGVRFEKVPLDIGEEFHSKAVFILYGARSGELVIGKRLGGISILKNGRLTHYNTDLVRRAGSVRDVTQDADGTFWASTDSGGLLRFDGDQWEHVGTEWGLGAAPAFALMVDQQGTLWVTTTTDVLYLKRRARRFETAAIRFSGSAGFSQSVDGRVWLSDSESVHVLPFQDGSSARDPAVTSRTSSPSFFDRTGAYWVWNSANPSLPAPAITDVESLDKAPSTGLEDRDGNIWIASNGPMLYRLRRPEVVQVRASRLAASAVVTDWSGKLWFSVDDPVERRDNGIWTFDAQPRHVQPDEIQSATTVARETDGTIWLAGSQGLWRSRADRFDKVLDLPDGARDFRIRSVSLNCAGGLWMSVEALGLFKHDGIRWTANGSVSGLPKEAPTAQSCDLDGRLWLGYDDGTIARVAGESVTMYGPSEGLQVGPIFAISTGAKTTVVAGERGLALMLKDERFLALHGRDPELLQRVTNIVETPSGDIWILIAQGVGRLASKDLEAQRVVSGTALPVELYDARNGFPVPGANYPIAAPTLALGSDGRLWLAAAGDIAWIDSTRSRKAATPAPMFINGLLIAGERADYGAGTDLPQGTRSIQIDYAGLDYSHPDRLRFRYRLEGVDPEWVEAGTRRQAFYSNLGPGNFRFVANVTDEYGNWTDSMASINVRIPPTFVQSRTFLALCAVFAVGVLAFLYQVRIRQLTSRERLLAQSRLRERERIARELHDTLLQSTQAIVLMVDGAVSLARKGESNQELLEKTLASAQKVLVEGRDRIQDLRLDDPEGNLATSLRFVGDELAEGSSVAWRVVVEGDERTLAPAALDEAYRIGREAMTNAFRHAAARSIEVQLLYSPDEFRMRIRDDGVGIDDDTLRDGNRAGHWGLPGMRERAKRLDGTLSVRSRKGDETEIELRISSQNAYSRSHRSR